MDEILKLRLQQLKASNVSNFNSDNDPMKQAKQNINTDIDKVKILSLNQVWNENKDTGILDHVATKLKSALVEVGNKLLIPLNINNKHWVGIAIERENKGIKISYMDPEQQEVPQSLKAQLIDAVRLGCLRRDDNITFQESLVQKQQSNNCGPEVIENFILHLTGTRFDQNETVTSHSRLFEDKLVDSNYSDHQGYSCNNNYTSTSISILATVEPMGADNVDSQTS